MYIEDLDYSQRLLKARKKLLVAFDSKIYQKIDKSNGDKVSYFSAYYIMRNRVKFIKNNLSLLRKITSLGFILLTRPLAFYKFIKWDKVDIINAQIKGIRDGF